MDLKNGDISKDYRLDIARLNQCLVRGYISERICYNQLIRLDIHRIIEGAEIRGKGTQEI
ncbi:hypothetical protein A3860_20655 [Niastella vici]|uniref:Uncharacterized protein n=1 Tax=Niastella vici TaxID=1703345 RepID=A0A1V9G1A5_9BACT|nr:hypothetical protein A3860_20655 [Niastella vici]